MSIYDSRLIDDLPLGVLGKYVEHAIEQDNERVCWEMWLTIFPDMMRKKIEYISFESFKKNALNSPKNVEYSILTSTEVIDEMEAIVNQYRKRR